MSGRTLVLVGKPGCHLCEAMREVVSPVAAEMGLRLDERDVREDPELETLYASDIPVLLLDGREVARHRLTGASLRERLAQMGHA